MVVIVVMLAVGLMILIGKFIVMINLIFVLFVIIGGVLE